MSSITYLRRFFRVVGGSLAVLGMLVVATATAHADHDDDAETASALELVIPDDGVSSLPYSTDLFPKRRTCGF
jgi:hypothetical protein